MFNGKMKAITFSYDDGVTQDIRLAELFRKYGMKATFNLNSELLGLKGELIRDGVRIDHNKVQASDVKEIYSGHEVAAHTLTHPFLPSLSDEAEIIRQVEGDRLNLSLLCGYGGAGFAFPGGGINHSKRVADIISRSTGVKYCRTTDATDSFDLQDYLWEFNPTVYHHTQMDRMFELGEKFLEMKPDEPKVFYIWGHAYEFDIRDDWARFEDFLKMMSGAEDIFYGTNREILLASH